jgi:hypothetical protein
MLVPGGRVCCVIGDILVPRRIDGRHRILPLPADIMVRSRKLGLDTLTPILWYKIGNRTNEQKGVRNLFGQKKEKKMSATKVSGTVLRKRCQEPFCKRKGS